MGECKTRPFAQDVKFDEVRSSIALCRLFSPSFLPSLLVSFLPLIVSRCGSRLTSGSLA